MMKLVIFDLDGTLVDAYAAITLSLNHALQQVGLPAFDHGTVKRRVGWGDRELIEALVDKSLSERVLSLYRGHHPHALASHVRMLPRALELLEELQQKNIQMAIASNRPTVFTRMILENLGILKYFAIVMCADQGSKPKPSGDMLLRILDTLSINAHETLYVGDMTIDIACGQEAGIRTVAVATGSSLKEELQAAQPYKLIDHLGVLKEINNI